MKEVVDDGNKWDDFGSFELSLRENMAAMCVCVVRERVRWEEL